MVKAKKNYPQKVKILRQEISWSNDRLKLAEWSKHIKRLDEYRKKLEDDDESDS